MSIMTYPCGHRTKHGQRVGCCGKCHRLFSSDSAFTRHMPVSGECVDPASVGLVARPSRTAPGEVIWGGAGSWDRDEDEPRRVEPDTAFIDPDEWAERLETARRKQTLHDLCGPDEAVL